MKKRKAMKVKQVRTIKAAAYTLSRLYTEESGYLCDILEPPCRGVTNDMTLAQIREIKKKGKTAIAPGTYKVKMLVSPSMKDRPYAKDYDGKFPFLLGTKGLSGVAVHPGNTVKDTDACLLPGEEVPGGTGRIRRSVMAYKDLMSCYLWPAYERGEEISWTIE